MKSVARIHQGKTPIRKHYIAEWLEARDMEPMDLLSGLNESDTSLPAVDKSQVYRWLKGQMPQDKMLARIAEALEIRDVETREPDPNGIFRHPDHDWLESKFKGRERDEIERIKQMVDLAFPPKTGTNN